MSQKALTEIAKSSRQKGAPPASGTCDLTGCDGGSSGSNGDNGGNSGDGQDNCGWAGCTDSSDNNSNDPNNSGDSSNDGNSNTDNPDDNPGGNGVTDPPQQNQNQNQTQNQTQTQQQQLQKCTNATNIVKGLGASAAINGLGAVLTAETPPVALIFGIIGGVEAVGAGISGVYAAYVCFQQ